MQQEMDDMQGALLKAALERREAASVRGATKDEFIARMAGEGGFVYGGFCGDKASAAGIKEQTHATIRVLPDVDVRSPVAPATSPRCNRPAVAGAGGAKAP